MSALSERLDELKRDGRLKIESVRVTASASMDGNSQSNSELSENRANQMIKFLRRKADLSGALIDINAKGVDWDGLLELAENSDMPDKEEITGIIRYTPVMVEDDRGALIEGRKFQLQSVDNGRPWKYMAARFFPELRCAVMEVVCSVEQYSAAAAKTEEVVSEKGITPEQADTVIIKVPEPVIVVSQPTKSKTTKPNADKPAKTFKPVKEKPQKIRSSKPFYMDLRTNLLYDAALVLNGGAEFYVGRGWSIMGEGFGAWWDNDDKYERIYGGTFTVRKYFGGRAEEKPLTGHHLGLYGNAASFDLCDGHTGYLSDFVYGGGLEYGYAVPIGRRLNLDFSIGIGYLGGGKYTKYGRYPKGEENEFYDFHLLEKKNLNWIGPTRAEISLVWLLGRGNMNDK